jgi:predicted DNA-binding WGR domain protein
MAAATKITTSASLVFKEGTSHKFWRIKLDGKSHTVCFGRIGTDGQTQTKSFGSEEDAKKSCDKLIAEKRKKGYVDDGTDGSTSTVSSSTIPAKPKSAAKLKSKAEVDAVVEEKVTTATPTASMVTSVVRSIGLEPHDWFLAKFRKNEPLKRGEPRPFDNAACLKALGKLKTINYGWDAQWEDLNLPAALSKEESHFWLLAITKERDRDTKMVKFAETIEKLKTDGKIKPSEAWSLIEKMKRTVRSEVMLAVANLFTPEEIVSWMLTERKSNGKQLWQDAIDNRELVAGFELSVQPYLSEKQRKELQKLVAAKLDPAAEPDDYEAFPMAHYLAASLGMHTELSEIISSWEDGYYQKTQYASHYQQPHTLLCGLASAELVESEWRRLKIPIDTPEKARALIACTEYSALDVLADEICRLSNRDECTAVLKVLALVNAPEAAEPILRCKMESKAPTVARDWLDTNIGNAVSGLIEVAGGRSKLADAATEYLRSVKRNGLQDVIAAALKHAGNSEAAAKVQAEVLDREEKVFEPHDAKSTPKWLSEVLSKVSSSKKKLPGWAAAAQLPPLIIGDRRLNDEQLGIVLQKLIATDIAVKDELLTSLRENVEKSVRDDFAWKIFQHWQDDGCPSKEKWAMGVLGHLGDDGCVLKLTPMIRAWPGESQHARAVFGLECLRAIGSSVALMQLSGIAQKLKFKGLKTKAAEFVDQIAKEKGMTRDELEDRVVPDCGLDEQGKREFSFGPRSFSFVLGGDLKAMVRDETGKLRTDLPKPTGKDDPTIANESLSEWKLLKKQIKDVATIQSARLENAMVTGRRWAQDDFQMLVVRHPLMTHIAQKLIWATFDSKGNVSSTFRITEERDYANVSDESHHLPKDHVVGLVHPLEMTDDDRATWGDVLSDYEIVAPFAQLGRNVNRLEKSEEKAESLVRFKGLKLVAPTLVFTLEKMGWVRGIGMDGGGFDEHSKQFPSANVTAVVHYEGTVGMGYIDPSEMLTLEEVYFIPGMRQPSGYGWEDKNAKKSKLGTVHPIVISEVLADMQVLKTKAK